MVAAAAIAVAAVVAWLVLRDEDDAPERAAAPPAPSATATASPTAEASASPSPTPDAGPDGSLAIGITEPNPAFVQTVATHEPFERFRGELAKLAPAFYRLVVDWPVVQPRRGRPPKLDVPIGGCMRTVPPCASWNGIRAQLAALASRQREGPGEWDALVVVTGTPDWAAAPPSCERSSTAARSRPPRADALPAYRRLIEAITAEAAAQGARLQYWSPWNEPNHPYFLAPQRCSAREAAAPYVQLADAMRGALGPGQRLVLGELAGLHVESSESTTVTEFVAALPKQLVCSARIWGQHAYVGGRDPVDDAAAALRRHGCEREHEIWITETGTHEGTCAQMYERLVRWYRDPRVAAAFQYTFREDDGFPTGLISTEVDRPLPALRMWQAWGARERPTSPPPARSRCAR